VAESFDGLTVLVTGAAGGIGSALCRRFVAEGARVVAFDVDSGGLERLSARLPVETATVDLVDADEVAAATAAVGPVDVVVNNAGVTALGPFAETRPEALRRVVEVNLFGAVHVTWAALPHLVERRGRIGVLSSVAGFAPLVYRSAYAASKHALHGLFETLRAELVDTGVTVTMVCPTFADTGIETRAVARAEGPTGRWSTTGRRLSADEVAAATVEGLRRRRRLVLVGSTAKLAWLMSRLAPARYERIMRARISRT